MGAVQATRPNLHETFRAEAERIASLCASRTSGYCTGHFVVAIGGPLRTVLVTGAGGFVGGALLDRLAGVVRTRAIVRGAGVLRADERVVLDSNSAAEDWNRALEGVETVFHLAARVHQMRDTAPDPLSAFRAVNANWTGRLAMLAANAGVKRFVFLSTVKVHRPSPEPFRESDAPQPRDPYALSKWEAEQRLAVVARETGLRVSVLRPPLVYGAGVRANFLSLMRMVSRGVPLPLGAVDNRRSMVFVRNLADALARAAEPGVRSGTWLVSDGEDLSTPELVRRLARHLGRPARLVRVPPLLIRTVARVVGRKDAAERVLGSLQVDSRALRRDLEWTPPYSVDAGLEETARWFRGHA